MKGQLPAWQHWINGDMQELPFANGPLAPVSKAFSEVCEKTGNPFTSQGLATAMGKYPAIIKYSKWLRSTWLEEIALAAMVELQNELPLTSPMAGIEPVPVRNSKKHSGEEMNFELDLAAIYGHQLFAISCIASDRSGGETKKHLMEAYVRAQQLGGEEARVALLCCADNADEIARELKQEWHVDKHVKVFDRRSLYDLKGGFRSWILENRKVK
jgi:hypothetical protein